MRLDLRRAPLVLLQFAAVWANVRAQNLSWIWLLALPCLAAPFVQLDLGPRVLEALRQAARGLFLASVAFGAAWVLYPLMPEALVSRVGFASGLLLLLLGGPLALSVERLAPERGLVLASLGAFLAAALDPRAQLVGPMLLGFAAVVAFLALGAPGRTLGSLGFSVLAASLLAYGQVRLLPWAQPQFEAAIADALNPSGGLTGFGQGATLGDVAALSLSPRTALRVYAPRAFKLRGQALTRFDGRTWSVAVPTEAAQSPALALPGAGSAWLPRPGSAQSLLAGGSARVTVFPVLGGTTLFVPASTALARGTSGHLRWMGAGVLLIDEMPTAYELLLAGGPVARADGACAECLSLPARLDPRLGALAAELSAGTATPAERVSRTLVYLGRQCRYTLEPGHFRTADPLPEFLFDKRRGYCEYFASAAAVLLRLQGLETRYVKGFNVTEDQRLGDHYLVRESAAHAWIDVRLPGQGWSEQDPTPASDYAAAHPQAGLGFWSRTWEALAAGVGRLRLRLAQGDWSALLPLLALASVGALGPGLYRGLLRFKARRRPSSASVAPQGLSPELLRLVRLLDAQCARRGSARPSSRGLLEHLRGLPPERFPEEWRRSGLALAERVYAAAYGGSALTPDELRALGAGLERR